MIFLYIIDNQNRSIYINNLNFFSFYFSSSDDFKKKKDEIDCKFCFSSINNGIVLLN